MLGSSVGGASVGGARLRGMGATWRDFLRAGLADGVVRVPRMEESVVSWLQLQITLPNLTEPPAAAPFGHPLRLLPVRDSRSPCAWSPKRPRTQHLPPATLAAMEPISCSQISAYTSSDKSLNVAGACTWLLPAISKISSKLLSLGATASRHCSSSNHLQICAPCVRAQNHSFILSLSSSRYRHGGHSICR